jgi:shikimate dehydrogenase
LLTIRHATDADVDSLLAMFGALDDLHCEHLPHVFCGSSQRPRSREFVTNLLGSSNCALFVAELAEQVVGQVVVRLREAPTHPLLVPRKFGEIDDLFVMESARHQGVGRGLIEAADQWVRRFGVSSIELGVWEFNEPAIRLYAGSGYSTEFRRMRRILEEAG